MSAFETRRRPRGLYPTPTDGARVDISPPGLAWLPCPGAHGYRVEIDGSGVEYRAVATRGPVHCPDVVLPAGDYTWDVVALDAAGRALTRRGRRGFTVEPGARPLPRPRADALLARAPTGRPRVILTPPLLADIRATLETRRAPAWRALQATADAAVDREPPPYPDYGDIADPVEQRLTYKRYHRALRRIVDRDLSALSLAWLVSGDARYGDTARRLLLTIAAWPTDDDDLTSILSPVGDEPGLSLARCAHRVYDWLHPLLDPAERVMVREMCRRRAEQALRRLVERHDYLSEPGESHAGRLIPNLVEMAVALAGEAPEAPAWLDYALDALMTFYPHWSGADGGWAQGLRYCAHYHIRHLGGLETLRAACGLDLWVRPAFRELRNFVLYCTSPRAEMLPFGDGAEREGPGELNALVTFMRHHAHRFDDPHAGWWAAEADAARRAPGADGARSGAEALIFADAPPAAPPIGRPGSRAFRGVGWAAMHGDLAHPERDTLLLFKCSPFGSVSHSHADQGAFALFHGGRGLAIPSGYYGPRFGMPHHAQWTRSTRANNCVLVGGRGQPTRDPDARGQIVAFDDGPDFSHVVGEAGPAYAGRLLRATRHILFLRPGVIAMLDVLEAPKPARYQWMLHAYEEMALGEGTITSRRDGSALRVGLHAPGGLRLRQSSAFDPPYNAGTPAEFRVEVADHWHVEAETVTRAAETRIAALMVVDGPGERARIEPLSRPGWRGQRVHGAFGVVEVWACLEPGRPGPAGHGEAVDRGEAHLCGRTRAGEPVWR